MALRERLRTILGGLPRQAMVQSGGLSVGTGITRLGSLVAAVIVGRQLGTADLGRYAAAVALGAVLVSGPGSGLIVMTLRDAAADRWGRRYIMGAVRAELIVTVAATVPVVLIATAVIHGGHGAALGALAGLGNVTLVQFSLSNAVGIGLRRHRLVVMVLTAAGVTQPVLTYAAVSAGFGVDGALWAMVISGAFWAVVTFAVLAADIAALAPGAEQRGLLWRSKSFVGLGAVSGGYQRLDAVVTLWVAGAGPTGLYASAYRFLGPFDVAETGFSQVFYPRLSSIDPTTARFQEVRRRGTVLYCLVVIPPALVAAAVMPWLLPAVFGGSFKSAVTPARVLMLSLVPSALSWPQALALTASGRESTVLWLILGSTVLDAVLVVALAGPYGAAGAAWAWVAAEAALCAGVVWAGRLAPRPPG